VILTPRDFPEGFHLKRTDHLFKRPDMKCIGVFPVSFQFNQLVIRLIADRMHQPYVQN
jgi:hypothetical protein